MIPVTFKFLKNYNGMTLWPFLLVQNKKRLEDAVFMNHENIHATQQKELLIIFFYVWYFVDYVFQFFKYRDHDKAYRNIVFEREAYFLECDLKYLKSRKLFSFLKFYDKKYRDE